MNKEWDRLIDVRDEYHCILGKMLASDRRKVVELANVSASANTTANAAVVAANVEGAGNSAGPSKAQAPELQPTQGYYVFALPKQ
jgi:hypothetical protein